MMNKINAISIYLTKVFKNFKDLKINFVFFLKGILTTTVKSEENYLVEENPVINEMKSLNW